MNRFVLPLAVFAALVILLWRGLDLDPQRLPSALIDKPAPEFTLTRLDDQGKDFSPSDMAGQVWLLNVWASWCVACRQEHPVISSLAEHVDIVGLNYKDKRDEAGNWLSEWGDPYVMSAFDGNGDVGIDYGVYGVPETFVIDRTGRIRYKHVGPVSESDAGETLLPMIRLLQGETL